MADRFGSDQVERALAMQEGSVLANEVLRLRGIEKRAKVVEMCGTDAVRPTAHWILHGQPVADMKT